MINKGKEKYNELSQKIDKTKKILKEIFNSFLTINKNWK